jgi:hypothetical protein
MLVEHTLLFTQPTDRPNVLAYKLYFLLPPKRKIKQDILFLAGKYSLE